MSPPIREGSGDSIGSIRLGDGSEISEVRTGAGDVLFSAIPDSVHLYTEETGNDGNAISTWSDTSPSSPIEDLTAAGGEEATLKTNVKNNKNILRSSNDAYYDVSYGTNISPPYQTFFVFKLDATGNSNYIMDGGVLNEVSFRELNNQYQVYNSSNTYFGSVSTDTNWHLAEIFSGDSNNDAYLQIDNKTKDTSSINLDTRTGRSVGGNADGDSFSFPDMDAGELREFDRKLTSDERSAVRSKISDFWGLGL